MAVGLIPPPKSKYSCKGRVVGPSRRQNNDSAANPTSRPTKPTTDTASSRRKSKAVPKGASHGSGHLKDVKNNGGNSTKIGDPKVNYHLQHHVGSSTKEECSSQSNAQRILFQIYKEIASHRQGNSSSITSYFTKLKKLWDELAAYNDVSQCCSCGAKEKLNEHVEKEKVVQFLMGLKDSYSTAISKILLTSPLPKVKEAYDIVNKEEKRIRIQIQARQRKP